MTVKRRSGVGVDLAKMQADLEKSTAPVRDLQERMRSIVDTLASDSAMSGIAETAKQIAKQQKAIEAIQLCEPPRHLLHQIGEPRIPTPPTVSVPPNPIYETNERLSGIEERFDQIQAIATEAANIATNLQASATEFLVKFEKAASNNDRSAARAITIGKIAMAIAFIAPMIQIIYTEYWRSPGDSAALQAIITDVKADLAALQEDRARALGHLSDVIAGSDDDTAAALRDLREFLANQSSEARQPPISDEESIAP